jgi:hypothetical protein
MSPHEIDLFLNKIRSIHIKDGTLKVQISEIPKFKIDGIKFIEAR